MGSTLMYFFTNYAVLCTRLSWIYEIIRDSSWDIDDLLYAERLRLISD